MAYTLPVYGLCISFHCCVRHELSVEEAHQLTVRLEKELRERLPLLGRILIHLEPPRTESAPLGKKRAKRKEAGRCMNILLPLFSKALCAVPFRKSASAWDGGLSREDGA